MLRAIELARLGGADGHGGPFGCVVVRDGEIIGEGFNRVLSAKDPTAHGEIVALRQAAAQLGSHDLSDCTVYNISVPCPMYLAALYWARVKAVYYCCKPADAQAIGFDNAKIATQLVKPIEEQSLPLIELPDLYPTARAVYDDWSKKASERY